MLVKAVNCIIKVMTIKRFWEKFFEKKTRDIRAAIDIGSMSIKTVLFEKDGDNINILKKLVIQFPAREDALSIVKFINNHIREEIFQMIKEVRMVPRKVVIGVSGDFLENTVEAVKVERPNKNKKISESEVTDIFKKAVADISQSRKGLVMIDSFPSRVVVDGYEIEELGKDTIGETIEIFTFASLMKQEYWDQFKNISRILGGIPLKFVSNQFVNAFSLPKILKTDDALLVDIGAKATEVSLISKKRVVSIFRFPLGGYHITQLIAEVLKIGFAEADNIKRQYEDQVLPSGLANKIKNSVVKGVLSWQREFMENLSLDSNFTVPENVFVFGGGLYLKELQDFLKKGEWALGFSWREKTNVVFLSAEKINHTIFEETKLAGFNEVSFLSLIFYSYILD